MPPSPTTIPTSFVPKQPVRAGSPYAKGGSNVFLFISFIVLGVVLLGTVGVFAYEQFLMSTRDSKAQAVSNAQNAINNATVEEFIQTRNRFIAADTLLDQHVAASSFFTLLESITLQTVRFNSLSFTLTDDRAAEITMDGTARTFNALAAQSSAFASENRIKRAIFSNISVAPNNIVTFSLSADLDPSLILFTAPETAALPETVSPLEENAQLELETPLEEAAATTTTP